MSSDLHSSTLSTESLCAALRKGFLPGPSETEEEFIERMQKSESSHASAWDQANAVLEPLMGFTIDWVPVQKAKRLFFWEGGATWIAEDGAAIIELKSWGYKPTEILVHEAVHILRCKFQEPRFEEHLAYATSSKPWRRVLGPLFRAPKETILFLLALLLGLYEPLWMLPVVTFFSARLMIERRIFQRCVKKVGLRLTAGLTDKEIARFSRMSSQQIHTYMNEQTSLRWQTLRGII
ncbi:MAG: hypothetical protein JSR58_01775 [Verrucomicrobia bacterium]|nr:hypothetical protein [Verrucomicrobiota bacterium]